MNITQTGYPVAVSRKLVAIIVKEIEVSEVDTSKGFIINLRDPDYSAEQGGYHPVEICVDANGLIQYITDFAYVGQGPYTELVKELDFDFSHGRFQQMGRDFPTRDGASLYKIWQSNFCSYYEWKVFQATVQPM
jgi:hypothetical protein